MIIDCNKKMPNKYKTYDLWMWIVNAILAENVTNTRNWCNMENVCDWLYFQQWQKSPTLENTLIFIACKILKYEMKCRNLNKYVSYENMLCLKKNALMQLCHTVNK